MMHSKISSLMYFLCWLVVKWPTVFMFFVVVNWVYRSIDIIFYDDRNVVFVL